MIYSNSGHRRDELDRRLPHIHENAAFRVRCIEMGRRFCETSPFFLATTQRTAHALRRFNNFLILISKQKFHFFDFQHFKAAIESRACNLGEIELGLRSYQGDSG